MLPTLWYSMWYYNYLFPLEPRRRVQLPSPLATISRISSLKVLGVTISSQMLISKHVFTVISSCAKSIYALRTLRSHGMNNAALHMIYTSGARPERMMSSLGKNPSLAGRSVRQSSFLCQARKQCFRWLAVVARQCWQPKTTLYIYALIFDE